MRRVRGDHSCVIAYNGEIYNAPELKAELISEGEQFLTSGDTEVILAGFMRCGPSFIKKLNGIFAIALWDESCQTLHLFRDRLGVKPLFYTKKDETTIFSSEIKGLFAYPDIVPELDRNSLNEIFALGPAKTYGKGVFKNILEVLPGEHISISHTSFKRQFYWKLSSCLHADSPSDTIEKTRWLLTDSIKKQMLSDVPICTFLSGGIDSSLVTAVCAGHLAKSGEKLNTFSFDFTENKTYFKSNTFQPSQDRPFAEQMAELYETNHHFLECSSQDQLDYLYKAVDARDLPCMADVESLCCISVHLSNSSTALSLQANVLMKFSEATLGFIKKAHLKRICFHGRLLCTAASIVRRRFYSRTEHGRICP